MQFSDTARHFAMHKRSSGARECLHCGIAVFIRLRNVQNAGMTQLIMIPALGCDARLYEAIAAHFPPSVSAATFICDRASFAGCVQQVLDHAPGRFVILGTSFGGRVAMELALAAPERLEGLVVIGAGPGPVADPAGGRRRTARITGGAFDDVVREMAAIISHVPGPNGPATQAMFAAMARTQGPDIMGRQSEALSGRIDLWPRLGEIACPSLFLWGEHDQYSPAADGLRFSATVQNGRFVQLPDCGHFPTLEYPDESAAVLAHWLADNRLT